MFPYATFCAVNILWPFRTKLPHVEMDLMEFNVYVWMMYLHAAKQIEIRTPMSLQLIWFSFN